jgi:hypothetical protein
MESLDQLKDKVDILFFDGGSNFQLAGRIIQARFPRVTVVCGGYSLMMSMVKWMGILIIK